MVAQAVLITWSVGDQDYSFGKDWKELGARLWFVPVTRQLPVLKFSRTFLIIISDTVSDGVT